MELLPAEYGLGGPVCIEVDERTTDKEERGELQAICTKMGEATERKAKEIMAINSLRKASAYCEALREVGIRGEFLEAGRKWAADQERRLEDEAAEEQWRLEDEAAEKNQRLEDEAAEEKCPAPIHH